MNNFEIYARSLGDIASSTFWEDGPFEIPTLSPYGADRIIRYAMEIYPHLDFWIDATHQENNAVSLKCSRK